MDARTRRAMSSVSAAGGPAWKSKPPPADSTEAWRCFATPDASSAPARSAAAARSAASRASCRSRMSTCECAAGTMRARRSSSSPALARALPSRLGVGDGASVSPPCSHATAEPASAVDAIAASTARATTRPVGRGRDIARCHLPPSEACAEQCTPARGVSKNNELRLPRSREDDESRPWSRYQHRDIDFSLQAFCARLPAIGHSRARDHAPHLRQRALVPVRAGGQAAHRRCRCRLGVQGASPRSHAARPRVSGPPAKRRFSRVTLASAHARCRSELTFPPPRTRSARSSPPPSPARRTNTRSMSTRYVRFPSSRARRASRASRPPLSDRSRVTLVRPPREALRRRVD